MLIRIENMRLQIVNMVDSLITANAEAMSPSKFGETPIHLAARGSTHSAVARELIEKVRLMSTNRRDLVMRVDQPGRRDS